MSHRWSEGTCIIWTLFKQLIIKPKSKYNYSEWCVFIKKVVGLRNEKKKFFRNGQVEMIEIGVFVGVIKKEKVNVNKLIF